MSSLGDLIPQLSTSVPLGATGVFLSQAYLVTEYSSFVLTMFSDKNMTVLLEWSSNAVNWDLTDALQCPANVATHKAFGIGNKWLRIRITNISAQVSTVMRFSAYASPTNVVVELDVDTKLVLTTNVRPSFDYSENGNLMVATIVPYEQYNFGYGTGSTAGNFEPGYTDLTFSTNKSPAPFYYFNTIQKGCFTLPDAGTTGTRSSVFSSDFAAWLPNVGIEVTFSASYKLNATLGPSILNIPSLLCGLGSRMNGANLPQEGIFIGFIASGSQNAITTPQKETFGILYRSDTLTPVSYFIKQEDWNLDNCTGVGTMPNITNWGAFNHFKINLLQNGNVLLSILNPTTGTWTPCHLLNLTNLAQSAFQFPYFRFIAYQSCLFGYPSYDNSGVSINTWSIGYQNNPVPRGIKHFDPIIFNYDHLYPDPPTPYLAYTIVNPLTWKGYDNFIVLYVDTVSTGFFSANVPAYMGIYKNVEAAGGTQAFIDLPNTPAVIYTVVPTLVALRSTAIYSRPMASSGNGNFISADLTNYTIRVFPGETISVVHFLGNSGTASRITSSLGFYQHH